MKIESTNRAVYFNENFRALFWCNISECGKIRFRDLTYRIDSFSEDSMTNFDYGVWKGISVKMDYDLMLSPPLDRWKPYYQRKEQRRLFAGLAYEEILSHFRSVEPGNALRMYGGPKGEESYRNKVRLGNGRSWFVNDIVRFRFVFHEPCSMINGINSLMGSFKEERVLASSTPFKEGGNLTGDRSIKFYLLFLDFGIVEIQFMSEVSEIVDWLDHGMVYKTPVQDTISESWMKQFIRKANVYESKKQTSSGERCKFQTWQWVSV